MSGYPHGPGHVHVDTSEEAARAVEPAARALESRIMQWLESNEGTSREIARALRLDWARVHPRTGTLRTRGVIEHSGEKRRDPVTGRMGHVLRIAPPPPPPQPISDDDEPELPF